MDDDGAVKGWLPLPAYTDEKDWLSSIVINRVKIVFISKGFE